MAVRKKKARRRSAPKTPIQIAVASTSEGPALYALTEDGEIYEYALVHDEDKRGDVGMWEPLSSISPENIFSPEEEEEDEDGDEEA